MLPFMDEKLEALAADTCVMRCHNAAVHGVRHHGPDASCTLMCPFIASIVISPEMPSTETLPFIVLRSSVVCFGTFISDIEPVPKTSLDADDIVLLGGVNCVDGLIQPVHSGQEVALTSFVAGADRRAPSIQ